MSEPENKIPKGWRLYHADFSIDGRAGWCMLVRDKDGAAWWHKLDEDAQENTPLYVSGFGTTINKAIDDAIQNIPEEAV